MKTLKYYNANKAIDIEYLTDLIDGNEELTIYQATQIVDGVAQVGINGTAETFGMIDVVDEFTLTEMKTLATDKNLTLEIYEEDEDMIELNALTALNITTASIDGGNDTVAYEFTFAVEGGNEPYIWTTESTLPAGITLSTEGVLSGTPTETGTFSLDIVVTDQFGVTDTLTADLVISA